MFRKVNPLPSDAIALHTKHHSTDAITLHTKHQQCLNKYRSAEQSIYVQNKRHKSQRTACISPVSRGLHLALVFEENDCSTFVRWRQASLYSHPLFLRKSKWKSKSARGLADGCQVLTSLPYPISYLMIFPAIDVWLYKGISVSMMFA